MNMTNYEKTTNTISMLLENAYASHKDDKSNTRSIKLFEHKNGTWFLTIWRTNAPKPILDALEHASQYAAMNDVAPEDQPDWSETMTKMRFKCKLITTVKAAPVDDSDDEEYIVNRDLKAIDYPRVLKPILADNEKKAVNKIVRLIAKEFVRDHETIPSELDYDLEVINGALADYECEHMDENNKSYIDVSELEEEHENQ